MKTKRFAAGHLAATILIPASLTVAFSSCGEAADAQTSNNERHWERVHKTLTAFQSDADLQAYIKRVQRLRPPPPPPPPPGAEQATTETVAADKAVAAPASITNNQVSGVDEGDIVKLRGDTLVVLRRGRLYAISIAGGAMRAVDSI